MNQSVHLAPAISTERLDMQTARALFEDDRPEALFELRRRANAARVARHGSRASFVDNLQINPSNICVRDCKFCGFAAKPGEAHGYVQREEEIFANLAKCNDGPLYAENLKEIYEAILHGMKEMRG